MVIDVVDHHALGGNRRYTIGHVDQIQQTGLIFANAISVVVEIIICKGLRLFRLWSIAGDNNHIHLVSINDRSCCCFDLRFLGGGKQICIIHHNGTFSQRRDGQQKHEKQRQKSLHHSSAPPTQSKLLTIAPARAATPMSFPQRMGNLPQTVPVCAFIM